MQLDIVEALLQGYACLSDTMEEQEDCAEAAVPLELRLCDAYGCTALDLASQRAGSTDAASLNSSHSTSLILRLTAAGGVRATTTADATPAAGAGTRVGSPCQNERGTFRP